jgi:hypothetical protein
MNDASSFGKLVPGFDFLQGLVKNAGAALPGVGQWVAPTLDPAEIDKRIEELRTVQFWLEQNARMLAATIQALEVQRMTLSTLQTMNVQMNDLQQSLQIKPAQSAPAKPAAGKAAPPEARQPSTESLADVPNETAAASNATPAVDPMMWWSALTKQFTEIATNAVQQGAGKGLAAAMGRQSIDGVAADKTTGKDLAGAKKGGRKAGSGRKDAKTAAKGNDKS